MAITKITSSVVAINAISGTLIADNAITAVHIAQNAVTQTQIAAGALSDALAANSITAAMIPNATNLTLGTVTAALTGNASGTAATVTGAAQSAITSLGTLTTLTVDDITINGSTISDGGDLDFDVGGNFIIDADGGGMYFKDGGTLIGSLANSSSDFVIANEVNDKDIIFRSDDGSGGYYCTFACAYLNRKRGRYNDSHGNSDLWGDDHSNHDHVCSTCITGILEGNGD